MTKKLENQVLKDLINFANDRCEKALQDVCQLIDDPQQISLITMAIASSALMLTARITQLAWEKEFGKEISFNEMVNAISIHIIESIKRDPPPEDWLQRTKELK